MSTRISGIGMTSQRTRDRMINRLREQGIKDELVLAAMLEIPRHIFLDEALATRAYEDASLPIGHKQTISQPYIVALMLETLRISPNDKVLEVGTGSGYVTALLAELVAEVFSVERHPALAGKARELLAALGYSNVRVFTGDGTVGLPAVAPFDAILVSAAALDLPSPLIAQLRENGRMIIPIGTDESQQLQFIRKINGQPVITLRELVRFVPLVSNQE